MKRKGLVIWLVLVLLLTTSCTGGMRGCSGYLPAEDPSSDQKIEDDEKTSVDEKESGDEDEETGSGDEDETDQEAQTTEDSIVCDTDNILLIGVDRRDSTWYGNSDTMILLTINHTRQKIIMTSFMRDTRVNIPGYGERKLNSAFALAGPDLLVQTLTSVFDVPIDHYVWIDFNNMVSLVDMLGGVDVTMTPAEAEYVGLSIAGTQVVHLNGEQALKHSRDRFSGGNDYERTRRQRDVLTAMAGKLKTLKPLELLSVVKNGMGYVNYNFKDLELISFCLDLLDAKDYQLAEQRIPYDGLYHNDGYDLVPDLPQTKQILHDSLN